LPADGGLRTWRYWHHTLPQVSVDERGFTHVGFANNSHKAGTVTFRDLIFHGELIVLASVRAVKHGACLEGMDDLVFR
jgi:hypothetical protein